MAAAAGPAASNATAANASLVEEPDDNNLRLLSVRVHSYTFDGLLEAYASGGSVLVPLGELASLTDLAIKTQPEKGTAVGFLYDEKRTFYLDVARRQVILSGKIRPLNRDQVKVYPNDIYVDADLLSQWLPFKIDVDLYSSTATLRSSIKLPFEARMEREKRFARSLAQRRPVEHNYPGYFEPYASWSTPFLTTTINGSAAQNGTTGQTGFSGSYVVHGTGDLLDMESTLYVNGSDQSPVDNIRFTMGRKDEASRLLGALNASEYAFGDVNSPNSALISTPHEPQMGVMVSSYPLARQSEYDRQRFQGELLPGWQVELYQNNVLIGYQTEPIQGQYIFDNVPLYFGKNYFRLVFYGPQGQRREETHSYELSDALLQPGKKYYGASATQGQFGGYHTGVQYDYGLAKNLSMSFEYQGFTLGSQQLLGQPARDSQYGRVGFRSLLGGIFFAGDVVGSSNSGSMYELSAQGRIGDSTSVKLQNDVLNDYVSDTFPLLPDPLVSRLSVNLNSALPRGMFSRIPINLRYQRDGYASGAERQQLDNLLAVSYRRFSASNNLSFVRAPAQADQLIGTLALSALSRKYSLRGEIGYSTQPNSEITNASLTLDGIRRGAFVYSAGINRQYQLTDTQFRLGVSRPVGKFAFNASAIYSTAGNNSLNIGITMGVAQEPRTSDWKFDSRPAAGMGAVSARVFLDNDQDGVFSEGDVPLAGVAFKRNGSRLPGKTGKDGILFITNLTGHYPVDLALDTRTLEDPLWVPALPGVRISPRPGSVARIDFPIRPTGEIDGTTYLLRQGRNVASSDVVVQLINEHGKVIKTQKSAFDGFYVFDGVPYGTYLIRVAPSQVGRLGLESPRSIQLTVDAKHQFVSGMNIQLKRKASP
ncbi:MAG: hypothetical protein P8X48_06900 [Acidiferrobacteraceae bacterium]|jgi:hypothetical protein